MKYTQFLQLEELLSNNNILIEDIKENKNILENKLEPLNEDISLAGILGGGALLAGLIAVFGKNLIRLGIKSVYLKKIKSYSDKFKTLIVEKTSELAKKSAEIRQSVYQKKKELLDAKNKGSNIEHEYFLLKKRAKQIDAQLTKEINVFFTKISDTKTKEVYSKIDELKTLKDSQRIALKGYWDAFLPDIRVESFKKLIDDGILSDKDIVESLNKEFKKIKNDRKQRLINIQNDLNKKPEEQQEQPKEENNTETNKEEHHETQEKENLDKGNSENKQRQEQTNLKSDDNL